MKIAILILLMISVSYAQSDSIQNYYPLKVGNKWIYDGGAAINLGSWWEGYIFEIIKHVVDTIKIEDNLYYKIEESVSYFDFWGEPLIYLERYDSSSCYVFIRELLQENYYAENEYPSFKLCTEVGDTVALVTDIPRLYFDNFLIFEHYADSVVQQFGLTTEKKSFRTINDYANYSLVKVIGLTDYEADGMNNKSTASLKGCIINDIVYGDTSLITSFEPFKSNITSKFTLSQNYLNPFNPGTTIKYTTPPMPSHYQGEGLFVSLKVYDILGSDIATLVNEAKQPGTFEVEFDGSSLPSGVYFYRLTSGKYSVTKKMMLIR